MAAGTPLVPSCFTVWMEPLAALPGGSIYPNTTQAQGKLRLWKWVWCPEGVSLKSLPPRPLCPCDLTPVSRCPALCQAGQCWVLQSWPRAGLEGWYCPQPPSGRAPGQGIHHGLSPPNPQPPSLPLQILFLQLSIAATNVPQDLWAGA